jgi:predicted ferric reductase
MESKKPKIEQGGKAKRMYGALLVLFFALVLAAAVSIPFLYESQTLWYRFGPARTVLLTGQLAGGLAATSLFLQLLLGARGKFLEKIFGVANLLRWHKANALILLSLAGIHATLILYTEGLTSLFDSENWPELVGAALLATVLAMVVSSLFRQRIGLPFGRWRLAHRVLGYVAPTLVAIHILFVSDSFARGVPRAGLFVILAGLAAAILWNKLESRRQGV